MKAGEIRKFVKRQPFRHFWVHLTDGQSMQVRHPDNVIVAEDLGMLIVVDPGKGLQNVDLDQVVSVEYRHGAKGA